MEKIEKRIGRTETRRYEIKRKINREREKWKDKSSCGGIGKKGKECRLPYRPIILLYTASHRITPGGKGSQQTKYQTGDGIDNEARKRERSH